jgi:hypothetical protein
MLPVLDLFLDARTHGIVMVVERTGQQLFPRYAKCLHWEFIEMQLMNHTLFEDPVTQ